MKTRGRTQDGDANESGDGNEGSNGTCNGDEDGSGNRNDDRIGEGGGEAKNNDKPRTRVVDAMWETGETWVERETHVDNKGFVQ